MVFCACRGRDEKGSRVLVLQSVSGCQKNDDSDFFLSLQEKSRCLRFTKQFITEK
jgi:hypothetical protein